MKPHKKHELSPEGKLKIQAAQKKRWDKVREAKAAIQSQAPTENVGK